MSRDADCLRTGQVLIVANLKIKACGPVAGRDNHEIRHTHARGVAGKKSDSQVSIGFATEPDTALFAERSVAFGCSGRYAQPKPGCFVIVHDYEGRQRIVSRSR